MATALREKDHDELLDALSPLAEMYGANSAARRLDRVALGHRLAQIERKGTGHLPEYLVRLIAEALHYAPSTLADLPEESLPLRRVRLMRALIDRADLRPADRQAALRRHLATLATTTTSEPPPGEVTPRANR